MEEQELSEQPLLEFSIEDDKTYVTINGAAKVEVLPLEEHPIEDPAMPCYEALAYREAKARLEFVLDMYRGSEAWIAPNGDVIDESKAKVHLPPYGNEEDSDYWDRLVLSVFDNHLEPTISGFAGILTDFYASENAFKPFTANWNDIDLEGNSIFSFFDESDQLVMRDGYCGLMIEMSRLEDMTEYELDSSAYVDKIVTDEDIDRYLLRPYLVLIERNSIINWKVQKKSKSKQSALKKLVLRQWESVEFGYGDITYPVYRVYGADGTCETYLMLRYLDSPYPLRIKATQNTLGYIPFVLYDLAAIEPFKAKPLFQDLAEKSRDHYRLYSEYRDAMRKMNCPVPVRRGLIVAGQTDFSDVPPIHIGANSGIDIPENGDFFFAEPTGGALPTTRTELDMVLVQINQKGLNFLLGSEGAQRTAKEVEHESAQTQATLKKMSSEKQSVLNQIEALWAAYYRKTPDRIDGNPNIQVNQSLLNEIMNSEDMRVFSEMTEKGQLSKITLLDLLRQGRRLPRGHNPEDEMKKIQEQQAVAMDMDLDRQEKSLEIDSRFQTQQPSDKAA